MKNLVLCLSLLFVDNAVGSTGVWLDVLVKEKSSSTYKVQTSLGEMTLKGKDAEKSKLLLEQGLKTGKLVRIFAPTNALPKGKFQSYHHETIQKKMRF